MRPHLHFSSAAVPGICDDIVETYRLAAEKLGYPTSYAHACIRPGVINVLLFVWGDSWETVSRIHPDCIVVNFEQMIPGSNAMNEGYLGLLRRCYLWEYSKSNFHRYTSEDVNVVDYVPLAYDADADPIIPLSAILPDAEQDIDVVFFGALTERRLAVIHELQERGIRVVHNPSDTVWSTQQRDDYLQRAKLVLNLHTWGNSRVVEIARLSILFRRRKAVVCELYPDSEIDPALRDAVAGAPYARLADTVQALLAAPTERAALERKGLDIFSLQSQSALIGPALERFIAWRARQADRTAPARQGRRVTVCMALTTAPSQACMNTLRSLSKQCDVALDVVIVMSNGSPETDGALDEIEGLDVQLIRLPIACNRATGLHLAFAQASGDYVVFCDEGDTAYPERLSRQTALLDGNEDIDVVGCWMETTAETVRFAQRHHDIIAECLGPQPLRLSTCLLRRSFLLNRSVRHDPEYDHHEDFHFICKSAIAGARFAVVPEVLHAAPPRVDSTDPARAAELGARARSMLLGYLLPRSSLADVLQIAQLYDHLWPPSPDFAAGLLHTLARACTSARQSLQAEHEALTRALRHEALRLLRIFHQSGLIDPQWLGTLFADADISTFLAPARDQLPLQPLFSD